MAETRRQPERCCHPPRVEVFVISRRANGCRLQARFAATMMYGTTYDRTPLFGVATALATRDNENGDRCHEKDAQSRRDFLKGSAVVAGGLAAVAAPGLALAAGRSSKVRQTLRRPKTLTALIQVAASACRTTTSAGQQSRTATFQLHSAVFRMSRLSGVGRALNGYLY